MSKQGSADSQSRPHQSMVDKIGSSHAHQGQNTYQAEKESHQTEMVFDESGRFDHFRYEKEGSMDTSGKSSITGMMKGSFDQAKRIIGIRTMTSESRVNASMDTSEKSGITGKVKRMETEEEKERRAEARKEDVETLVEKREKWRAENAKLCPFMLRRANSDKMARRKEPRYKAKLQEGGHTSPDFYEDYLLVVDKLNGSYPTAYSGYSPAPALPPLLPPPLSPPLLSNPCSHLHPVPASHPAQLYSTPHTPLHSTPLSPTSNALFSLRYSRVLHSQVVGDRP